MRVAIVYHFFPHYRAAVLTELARRGRHAYTLLGSPTEPDGGGIAAWKVPPDIRFLPLEVRPGRRGNVRFRGLLPHMRGPEFDAVVLLGNALWPDTWLAAISARLSGKRVFFWTHGWVKRDRAPVAFLRRRYYRLAHGLLLYGHVAKAIGIAQGFDPARLHVIYNSLDVDEQDRMRDAVSEQDLRAVRRRLFDDESTPVVVCVSRLTPVRRLDLLLDAASLLRRRGRPLNILLVGDGPERAALEARARALDLRVCFYGPCYDEAELARLTMAANVTAAPGKVGLTAMQSLAYGTPVITHDDPFDQMPEWEAIVDGRSGSFFRPGDVEQIAACLERWTQSPWTDAATRRDCVGVIHRFYHPATQAWIIERALDGKPADDLAFHREQAPPRLRPPRAVASGAASR